MAPEPGPKPDPTTSLPLQLTAIAGFLAKMRYGGAGADQALELCRYPLDLVHVK
jgi:hypothetical protein